MIDSADAYFHERDMRAAAHPIPRCPADVAIDVIRATIERKRITQRELADRVGCTQSSLSRVLLHNADPSLALLRRMWIEAMR